MSNFIKTYKLMLIFCLILILITLGTSVSKIKNHKISIFNSGNMETTVNDDDAEVDSEEDKADFYDPEAESITPEFIYDGYYDTHPPVDRFQTEEEIQEDIQEDAEVVNGVTNITEVDIVNIISAMQSTEEKDLTGYKVTSNLQNKILQGELRIAGYENISNANIIINQLGISDDGEFIGSVTFTEPEEQTFNISGTIVDGNVDTLMIN